MAVLAVLLGMLGLLVLVDRHPRVHRFFGVVPLIVFIYFVPTALSNLGVLPLQSELYRFVRVYLLPASLVLLVLSVDLPSIVRLGRNAVVLFLAGAVGIVLGGPLAYLALGGFVPAELGDQAWKGLAALSGSWIGGSANFVAIGQSVGALDSTLSMLVVVDVGVSNIWTAVLLSFAGRERKMDERLGADRRTLDAVREEVERLQAGSARPASLADLLWMLAIAFGSTVACTALARELPDLGTVVTGSTWVVLLVTGVGVVLSFTPARKLEGRGQPHGLGAAVLLIATIGAQAEFRRLLDAPALVAVGMLWMAFHAAVILGVRRLLKAPIFFAAVGSQANVGGTASASVVAAAFHPALAPVGVLLAVLGYVLGTYGGLVCAVLLEQVYHLIR
ncbi:putative membrane protein [Stigmatella aurantiaca DW4/3-1]|uniref:Putative membrane protein n=2 Tax=Stigmatella aurantiaca TaxID=41 RepID=Q08YV2_STIAD|nr:putative membrane protein [Stigmatella aurantiaca DW4/3-1]